MSSFESGSVQQRAMKSVDDDILINKLLLSHDPDGRSLDSEQLLHAVENIMFYSTISKFQVFDKHIDRASNVELVGSEESLEHTIYKISYEMLFNSGDGNLHTRTMKMFDLLGNYKWDAKVALVLAAFALRFGEFCLTMQLSQQNPLVKNIAILKQVPSNTTKLNPQMKALLLLVKTMVDATKCIIKFESLPIRDVELDKETLTITKSSIYIAAYWITRSALACASQVLNLKAMKAEQVGSKAIIAAWELSSLMYRLSNILNHLKPHVDALHQELETKLYQKLLNIFKESHEDNQEVLHLLSALKEGLPLKDCSTQVKLGISELKNKVVILLVSRPEILPLEDLFLLVHQIHDHPHRKKLEGIYAIVWIPISYSGSWTGSEEESFNFLSNSLPWYSVRKPWSLNSAVVNFFKKEWKCEEKTTMVVLDSQGMITNLNAIDMVLIWGPKAYPFSISRQKELWEEEKWTMQLLIDEIDPFLAQWVEEGSNVCVYGSNNIDWIREFTDKLKEIKSSGVQLKMVYVGKNDPDEHVRSILTTINEEIHRNTLSFTKIKFFWLRLESIRRLKFQLGKSITSADHVLEEVSALLDINGSEQGWAVIGKGQKAEIVGTQGRKIIECLSRFGEWGGNVGKLGFIGALRTALGDPAAPLQTQACGHIDVVPYDKEQIEETMVCPKCKHLMKKKFILYE
ncbi:hypothetical protein SLE2022_203920 [Rubroshorea leprosula]